MSGQTPMESEASLGREHLEELAALYHANAKDLQGQLDAQRAKAERVREDVVRQAIEMAKAVGVTLVRA